MPRAEKVHGGEKPAKHRTVPGIEFGKAGHAKPPTQPAPHRLLHQPLAMPGEQHRRIGRQLRQQSRVSEQHDEIGVGDGVRESVARRGTEARPALPRPRLGEGEHHARAALVPAQLLRAEHLRGSSRWARAG